MKISEDLKRMIARTLQEDAAHKDVTSKLLFPVHHVSTGVIVVKEKAVLCGLNIARHVFQYLDKTVRFQSPYKDGQKVARNTPVATVRGKTRSLLAGERTALNVLGYLSGIATLTDRFVQKAGRRKVKILDTRKTTPGMRMLAKYAVRCGRGHNHRCDLNQHILLKDNHLKACASQLTIFQAIQRVRQKTKKKIEVEVDTLAQFREALTARPDMILLDNMSCAQLKKAVNLAKKCSIKNRPQLEASGGINLSSVAAVAKTGVDRISVGSLTHSSKAINVSFEILN